MGEQQSPICDYKTHSLVFESLLGVSACAEHTE